LRAVEGASRSTGCDAYNVRVIGIFIQAGVYIQYVVCQANQSDAVREAVDSGEYENTSKAVQAAVADFFEVQA